MDCKGLSFKRCVSCGMLPRHARLILNHATLLCFSTSLSTSAELPCYSRLLSCVPTPKNVVTTRALIDILFQCLNRLLYVSAPNSVQDPQVFLVYIHRTGIVLPLCFPKVRTHSSYKRCPNRFQIALP